MAEGRSTGKSVLLYGCVGCLGLVGLTVLFAAITAGVAWTKAKNEQVEDRVLTRSLAGSAGAAGGAQGLPGPAGADIPEGEPGRVVLEVSGAEFNIERAAAGDPLRVEARYDTRSSELDERFEPGEGGDPWSYRLTFRQTSSGFITGLRQIFGGTFPRVTVYLPRDVPMDLRLDVQEGGFQGDLGGLRLTDAEIRVEKGGFELAFSDPVPEPMNSLRISAAMGGFSARGIGNASPRELDITYSMGGMDTDLRGAWRVDSQVTIQGSMGGGSVRLPKDVRIVGVPGAATVAGDDPELPVPTLNVRWSSSMGDLQFY